MILIANLLRSDLFDYKIDGSPSGNATLWDHLPLSPLVPQVLTPISYSMLAEILRRGWYQYYDRLGFEPPPGVPVVRQLQGRAYLNLSLSARLETQHGAIEPLTFLVNQRPLVATTWEKPGLFGSLKTGRAEKKVISQLKTLESEIGEITRQTRDWYHTLLELKWSQADILQVMEQIERIGTNSLMAYFGARHNLELLYNRILWATQGKASFPHNLNQVAAAVRAPTDLVEQDVANQLQAIAHLLVKSEESCAHLKAWLNTYQSGNSRKEDWRVVSFAQDIIDALESFFAQYGHRGSDEGEIRSLRWDEDPSVVLQAVLVMADQLSTASDGISPNKQTLDQLLQLAENKSRKQLQQWLEQIPSLLLLQSRALHAFSYVQAGTRIWAKAASQEATGDGRLHTPDDVFFFELEEVKEMMTGEWNISATDEIQQLAVQRRQEFNQWKGETPSTLLLDDVPAISDHKDLSIPTLTVSEALSPSNSFASYTQIPNHPIRIV